MNISEIRRLNLKPLVKKMGAKIVADKYGCQESFVRQKITGNGTAIGDSAARKFEAALNLEPDYMDTPHPETWSDEESQPYKMQLLETILKQQSVERLREIHDRVLDELVKRSD